MGLTAPSMLVKYWMGHSLGVEKSYFIPPVEKQREKYVEAYREIDLFKTQLTDREAKLQTLKTIAESMGLDIIKIEAKHATTEDRIEAYQTAIAEQREREKLGSYEVETSYGSEEQDCERITSEEELQTWLAKGWHVVTVLKSGKVVISNE
jgi:hypothetical protein